LKKNPSQKRAGGVAQGIGPKFKSQCCHKNKQTKNKLLTLKGSITILRELNTNGRGDEKSSNL
jgi:hypothetical protein